MATPEVVSHVAGEGRRDIRESERRVDDCRYVPRVVVFPPQLEKEEEVC